MKNILFFACLCLLAGSISAQHPVLEDKIRSVIADKKASVGVAVSLNGGEIQTVNGDRQYAMLSTFKLPVAMAVLHQLDEKGIPLSTGLLVRKSDLLPDTYSPLRDSCPEGNFHISIGDLIKYSVSRSDNNACDILIRYLGGTQVLQHYIRSLGIDSMTIVATEEQMHQEIRNSYLNHTTLSSAVQLINLFLGKGLFSPEYQEFLESALIETSTGPDKLKGQLPDGLTVGHKTGSSDRFVSGLKIADNDMGFIRLPDGQYYAIAVFVMDSMEDDRTNAAIIAAISAIIYKYGSK